MKFFLNILVLSIFIFASCADKVPVPHPSGYMRIFLPEKKYTQLKGNYPYTFEYPVYGSIKKDSSKDAQPYWINIEFSEYKAKIHISYKKVNKNLAQYIEDSHKLVYKHSIKADAIQEKRITRDSANVYGIFFDIKGNVASSVQFYLTDSTGNFLRGALYFTAQPNKDSIAPVLNFFRTDIEHLINTFKWVR